MRRILHVDMDAFFAAIEQQRHPELAGKAVIVGGRGDPHARGVVSTASYEARKFGIHSAMPLRTACHLCPDGVFLPVDYAEYSRVSAVIKGILREFSPILEDVGIDEAYLDISGSDKAPAQIARDIKHRVKAATGLTCSIGVAPNKLLAKIASDLHKPDGYTEIGAGDVEAVIRPLPVRKIPGVGSVTEEHLHAMGVQTVGQLAALPPDRLTETFGRAHGTFLHQAARGIDERTLVTHWEPKSHSREITFQRDTGNWQTIARTLAGLCREVADDLAHDGSRGRTVGIKLRFADFETHTREKTLDFPTDSANTIRRTAFECLGRIELDRKVRLIGVRVGELEKTRP
ncbi:MAG: DNA polymerase IV [Gammaproteobacteria bacterium]|nr:DNA polymerase IV [Gammaproteobacteria bacterium]